jgi:pyruvate,water dikinase
MGLKGDIFYLEPSELPRLIQGERFEQVIAERKRRRAVALTLEVPSVLFSDSLQEIGQPVVVQGATELVGTPLSAGVAEGTVLVLLEPTRDVPEQFILVCPTTDPAWVPLFLKAKALIMETGGILSHGAIVAREFNLPAVAGLPNVCRQLTTGQRVRVDGNTGRVHVFTSHS